MGRWGAEDSWQDGGWQTQRAGGLWDRAGQGAATRWWLADPVAPHSHIDKPGGPTGDRNRPCNPGLQLGEIKPQTSD